MRNEGTGTTATDQRWSTGISYTGIDTMFFNLGDVFSQERKKRLIFIFLKRFVILINPTDDW